MNFKENIIRLLTQPAVPDCGYYWITLLANSAGKIEWSIQTQWCGYTKESPRREIREGSLYNGEAQRAQCHEFGEPMLLINAEEDVHFFYGFGGHALIAKSVAEKRFSHLIAPHTSLRDSGGLGFRHAASLTNSGLQHAPSKKLRMQVLDRDKRRCLICGRSPMYYVDVERHVHHAIPWGRGGVTEEANLISVCKTCHDGLEPHEDYELIKYLAEMYPRPGVKHFEDLNNYQAYVRARMSKA